MDKDIGLIKLLFAAFLVAILFIVSACSDQQRKNEQGITNVQTKAAAINKLKMRVDGMTCMACQSNVKNAIKSLDGVMDVEVSLEKRMAFVSYDSLKVKPEQIQKVVNDKGYTASKPIKEKQ